MSTNLLQRLPWLSTLASACSPGTAAASGLHALWQASQPGDGTEGRYMDPLLLGLPLKDVIGAGFPVFGVMAWLTEHFPSAGPFGTCSDKASRDFQELLAYHLDDGSEVPMLKALQYAAAAASAKTCPAGRASALLAVAASLADEARSGAQSPVALDSTLEDLISRAEQLLSQHREAKGEEDDASAWPVWRLLHRLEAAFAGRALRAKELSGCLLLIYAYPTEEIRRDTVKALEALERHYLQHFGVAYPLIVFTDEGTAPHVASTLGRFTSSKVVPAVIPKAEISRPMSSYSCVDGVHCAAGHGLDIEAHRGVVNGAQYWSPDYLRISRYSAGPLFRHPALDSCSTFLKIDTDFYFVEPLERDPIQEMQTEGSLLGYWQIHVQGQRQVGYMDAALEFLKKHDIPVRNKAFYARGRFEEKAERLGIPVEAVPEALEAATVIYGCLFGGSVSFFREPLYQSFFRHMDAKSGFETNGWSNQFFLGTAAASFMWPSQVRRLYIGGTHQESRITVANGNVTEFLLGSSKSVMR